MQNATTVTAASPATIPASPPQTTTSWRTEDWIAVVLGFAVIIATLAAFHWKVVDLRNIVPSLRWTTDAQIAQSTPGWIDSLDSIAREADAKGQQNVVALS